MVNALTSDDVDSDIGDAAHTGVTRVVTRVSDPRHLDQDLWARNRQLSARPIQVQPTNDPPRARLRVTGAYRACHARRRKRKQRRPLTTRTTGWCSGGDSD